MEDRKIYEDIALRTEGDIYIGVVGPVRTGKSTFIKRFMETMVIPNIENVYRRERARDELPQSGSGRTIMTAEPKFVPEEAVTVSMEGGGAFQDKGHRNYIIFACDVLLFLAMLKWLPVEPDVAKMCIRDSRYPSLNRPYTFQYSQVGKSGYSPLLLSLIHIYTGIIPLVSGYNDQFASTV